MTIKTLPAMGILLQMSAVFMTLLLTYVQVEGFSLMTHECRSPLDCGPGECCVLGMMRYSTAQCMPLGQVDNYCREDNEPENRTLFYPNGMSVDVVDIYTHVCPCGDGLTCEDNFCAVQEDTSYESNYLY